MSKQDNFWFFSEPEFTSSLLTKTFARAFLTHPPQIKKTFILLVHLRRERVVLCLEAFDFLFLNGWADRAGHKQKDFSTRYININSSPSAGGWIPLPLTPQNHPHTLPLEPDHHFYFRRQ